MVTNLPQEAWYRGWCCIAPKSAEHVRDCSKGTTWIHTTCGYLEQSHCSQVPLKPKHKPHIYRGHTINLIYVTRLESRQIFLYLHIVLETLAVVEHSHWLHNEILETVCSFCDVRVYLEFI